ncbi:recombinase family protein [Pedobacter chitinilyticus]|uniref:Recombinase family protein n=1 Tax=Pedobacter chitinilyticus TaxID=2233776 RepID=A0A443Z2C2_9SPHI|nr:recombinase family protein [Pedobacter chitinilyticus]RWU10666.1 recombinase family protein [Pedobacter chitinilyticus]
MKAIAYIRSATNDKDYQLEAGSFPQDKTIENYCYINNIELLQSFYDVGVSGSDFKRKGWVELEDFLLHNSVDLLIVTDYYDRIGSDIPAVKAKIAEIEQKRNLQILALARPVIPSTEEIENLFNP